MATVTYDGVAGDEGGNMFAGTRFWVALRVPLRQRLVEQITQNGGFVVPLEKQADICVADHARKDAPAGSYSWKLIADSVSHGIMQILDKYLIGPDPDLKKVSGASLGHKKSTRTAFTTAEDAALAQHVLSKASGRLGNAIYQDWANDHPSHTFQSWRDRWVKRLSLLPPEALNALIANAPGPAPTADEEDRSRSSASKHPRQAKTVVVEASAIAQNTPRQTDSGRKMTSPRTIAQVSSGPLLTDDTAEKGRFNLDYQDFLDNDDSQVKLSLPICDKEVELFDLAQAVRKCGPLLSDAAWHSVAKELGFSSSRLIVASQELRACYEESLESFLEALDSFQEMEASNTGSDGEIEEEIFETAQMEPNDRLPSTPPQLSDASSHEGNSRKRLLSSNFGTSGKHASKRRKRSHQKEVPSTPDTIVGVTKKIDGLGNPPNQSSPSSRLRGVIATSSSPISLGSLPGLAEVISVRQQNQPGLQTTPAKLQRQESTFDVTPSQQLQFEDLEPQASPNLGSSTTWRRGQVTSSVVIPEIRSINDTTTQNKTSAKKRQVLSTTIQPSVPPRTLPESARPLQTTPNFGNAAHQANPRTRHNENAEKISQCIEHYESLGYAYNIVVRGLRSTTMTPGGQAAMAMQSLKDGQGIPSHHEGIWTTRDDNSLRLVDSVRTQAASSTLEERQAVVKAKKDLDRLVKKHGLNRIDLRRKFLTAEEEMREQAIE